MCRRAIIFAALLVGCAWHHEEAHSSTAEAHERVERNEATSVPVRIFEGKADEPPTPAHPAGRHFEWKRTELAPARNLGSTDSTATATATGQESGGAKPAIFQIAGGAVGVILLLGLALLVGRALVRRFLLVGVGA